MPAELPNLLGLSLGRHGHHPDSEHVQAVHIFYSAALVVDRSVIQVKHPEWQVGIGPLDDLNRP